MVEVENLIVSLTKNGGLKTARLVMIYPSNEILDHVSGSIPHVNLVRSQVANILCADPLTDSVPALWDAIRDADRPTIQAFTFVAILFSHHRLIEAFRNGGRGAATGTIFREGMSEKEYTNLQFMMAEVGLCEYARGTDQASYDMAPLVRQLQSVGDLVGQLLRAKLRRCGWRDPDVFVAAPDLPLPQQCIEEGFNEVFGMTSRQFTRWIGGRPTQPR
jgi:hypothetical protein